jgi:hypothetical protein
MIDDHSHRRSAGVPPTGDELANDAILGLFLALMKWLRIVGARKGHNFLFAYEVAPEFNGHARNHVLKVADNSLFHGEVCNFFQILNFECAYHSYPGKMIFRAAACTVRRLLCVPAKFQPTFGHFRLFENLRQSASHLHQCQFGLLACEVRVQKC